LKAVRDPRESYEHRTYCGIAAAPYCHVKLKAIERTGQQGGPVEQKVVLTFD
jgi:hypothetical protein